MVVRESNTEELISQVLRIAPNSRSEMEEAGVGKAALIAKARLDDGKRLRVCEKLAES